MIFAIIANGRLVERIAMSDGPHVPSVKPRRITAPLPPLPRQFGFVRELLYGVALSISRSHPTVPIEGRFPTASRPRGVPQCECANH